MIKFKDLLFEDIADPNDKRQYLADVQAVNQAISALKDAFMNLQSGNYHSNEQHAQTVLQSMVERADLLKTAFEKAYMNKYYKK